MSDELVLCDVAEQVAVLTLNRPGAANALSDAMLAALKARLEAIAVDQAIKVVVIRGAGKVFCGGHDLKEMQAGRAAVDGGAAYFADLFTRCGALMQMIPAMPQPVEWVSATQPSTPGKSASMPEASTSRAMKRATEAEQFTLVSTPI